MRSHATNTPVRIGIEVIGFPWKHELSACFGAIPWAIVDLDVAGSSPVTHPECKGPQVFHLRVFSFRFSALFGVRFVAYL